MGGVVNPNPSAPARTLVMIGLSGVLALGLGACGIPTGDDTFSEIPTEEVLFGLDAPSTTTSTTTTTIPIAPVTTEAQPTTTIVPLEEVEIYFLSRGALQPVPVALTTDFAPDQVVDALEKGPPPGVGLDTHIEPGLIVSTEVAEGVVLAIQPDAGRGERILPRDYGETDHDPGSRSAAERIDRYAQRALRRGHRVRERAGGHHRDRCRRRRVRWPVG